MPVEVTPQKVSDDLSVSGRESLLCTLVGERRIGEQMEWRSVKANRVRRNLFGPVDHEQLQQDFQHMLHSSMEGAQQKWNFDFLRDMPAEGLLQWEELQSHDVPAFYHSCVVGEARKPLKPLNQGIVKEVKAHHFATVTLTENPKVAKKMSGKKSQAVKKRRQTSLTDYYSAKKQVKTNSQAAAKNLAF
ncbi:cyclin-dependent kinase inhibitor 1-like [Eretmochelys imbricata]